MDTQPSSLETLQDIKRIMERSSRFISLSGLSGVSAGICALAGSWIAYRWINLLRNDPGTLLTNLVLLALAVMVCALASAFYFTWRKARKNGLPVWDHTSKKLLTNLAIPLGTGGLFAGGLLYHNEWQFVAPACLVFYGLALVNASKYTLRDIRYLGLLEIALGLINIYYVEYSLYCWALGFGVLHIIYGVIMWSKYDKRSME